MYSYQTLFVSINYSYNDASYTILRDNSVTNEITVLTLDYGKNIIICENQYNVVYFDTIFLSIDDLQIKIVKNLYLHQNENFQFSIQKFDTYLLIDDRDEIIYNPNSIIQFITTGYII
jgi:hypothetical protein